MKIDLGSLLGILVLGLCGYLGLYLESSRNKYKWAKVVGVLAAFFLLCGLADWLLS